MASQADQFRGASASIEARHLAQRAAAGGRGAAPDEALALHRQARALLEPDGNSPLLVDVLRWEGSLLRDRGMTNEAEALYARSLHVAAKVNYASGRAHALNCLAILALRRGDGSGALRLFHAAATAAERCGETRLTGMVRQNLGILADIRGETHSALESFLRSLEAFETTDDAEGMTWALTNLGIVYAKQACFKQAEDVYARALALAQARCDLHGEGLVHENLAEMRLRQGELAAALTSIERALALPEPRGDGVRAG